MASIADNALFSDGRKQHAAKALLEWIARRAESLVLPLAALVIGLALFSLFIAMLGKSPADLFDLIWRGGFGSWFSIKNTLSRAAPLLLAALCVALPARLGLVVIGGEGAIVLGGVAAAAAATLLAGAPVYLGIMAMAFAAMLAGGIWIGAVGALRHYRAVNETISSLLMAYIAIALMNHLVEGPLRDPASLNKPSTHPIDPSFAIGSIPGLTGVHWGLALGIAACIVSWILIEKTRWGFAARIAGDNVRAAQVQGLPVGPLIVGFCILAGAFAGLAGMIEVAAVQGDANASIAAGYGYTGILVAFLARQNPLAIVPVAILIGGIEASGGLLQRRMELPNASVQVLQGMIFIVILLSETFYGRYKIFNPDLWKRNA